VKQLDGIDDAPSALKERGQIFPISLGDLHLKTNVFHSPLAGCSDYPFRKMVRKFSEGLIFCEMVKMDPLVRYDSNTLQFLDYSEEMRPIGAQLCGSKPEIAEDAAKIIEEKGFDILDLNCGCPVDKVTKDGSGSALLKEPKLLEKILTKLVKSVSIPVTIKIRAGWCENSINCDLITQMAESCGAKAVFVHGRTRKQAYRGPANRDYIAKAQAKKKKIALIGNGDVFCDESARGMFKDTNCDGILLSRGLLGAPWLGQDIERKLTGKEPIIRDHLFVQQMLKEHISYVKQYKKDPRRVLIDMKRISCWYLKKEPGVRQMREKITRASSVEEVDQILNFS